MKIKKTIVSTIELDLDISGATLLTIEEAKRLPERLRRYDDNWWWLKSSGYRSDLVANVSRGGFINDKGSSVDCDGIRVRPALIISNIESSDLKIGDTFEFGDKQFEIISNDKAFCSTAIGTSVFREDWSALDANDYEKSDVKKYIDNWFEKESKD